MRSTDDFKGKEVEQPEKKNDDLLDRLLASGMSPDQAFKLVTDIAWDELTEKINRSIEANRIKMTVALAMVTSPSVKNMPDFDLQAEFDSIQAQAATEGRTLDAVAIECGFVTKERWQELIGVTQPIIQRNRNIDAVLHDTEKLRSALVQRDGRVDDAWLLRLTEEAMRRGISLHNCAIADEFLSEEEWEQLMKQESPQ